MNILVVEDDRAIREMIATILSDMGHRPIRLKHGREALEAVWRHVDLDLIICDLRMPEMDGYELIGHLRGIGCVLPIIVVTGVNDDHGTVKGADKVLLKPIRVYTLRTAVDDVCAPR